MATSRIPKIDLNLDSETKLTRALKISPRLAQRIIRMRPYHTTEDLKRIWGLDEATMRNLSEILKAAPDFKFSEGFEVEGEQEQGEANTGKPTPLASQSTSSLSKAEMPSRELRRIPLSTTLILLAILLLGAYLRLSGLQWDQNTHQHPDERFMTIVAERIKPVALSSYFDTANSTLNPFQNNASYTYGMLPLFVTRAVADWVDMTHYDKIVLVGRALSSIFDLAALFVLFVLGNMLFNRKVGLLAAGLYAVAVLPIQLSHYFAVDSFATVFIVSGFIFAYQAVPLLPGDHSARRINWVGFALFGLVTGLAMACKVNSIAFFGVIILAAAAYLVTVWPEKTERWPAIRRLFIGLVITAAVGFIAFRIANPYTFMGPNFYGLRIYDRWLKVIKEVTGQVAGKSEWPPNHHWTSRGVMYAWSNIVTWGLGWPLGLAGWAGFLYAAWRIFKGEWQRLFLIVGWVGGYFIWQNIQFWRYMRYFIPIYPFLVLLAAWGLMRLWDWAQPGRVLWGKVIREKFKTLPNWNALLPGLAAFLSMGIVVLVTALYAFGFTDIYRTPITRIQASNWMIQNIRGPLNIEVENGDGIQTYPISAPARLTFSAGDSQQSSFVPLQSGTARSVSTIRVSLARADLRVRIFSDPEMKNQLGEGYLIVPSDDLRESLTITLPSLSLEAGKSYYLAYTFKSSGRAKADGVILRSEKEDAPMLPMDWSAENDRAGTSSGSADFVPVENITINRIVFNNFSAEVNPAPATIEVRVNADDVGENVLATASQTVQLSDRTRAQAPIFTFDPVQLEAGKTYYVRYNIVEGGPVMFEGETYTLETSWDDALPLSIKPYSLIGGVYAPLNLQLYEPDTPTKRESMLSILDRSDYIVLPSNRSYDAMPRLTLRYPMTLKYYQALFGCDCSGDELEQLAARLEPPFKSPLGFELAASFTHHPSIGPFEINDQMADESFTVYDHPKVMIFKKTADFSIDKVRALLESVDLSQVVMQAPLAVSKNPHGYVMPADRQATQEISGTWAEMFSSSSLLNTSQPFGVLVWYMTILLLSLIFMPAVWTIFRRLPDRGYPLARIFALLAVGWAAWLLASLKLAIFTRGLIVLVILFFTAANGLLVFKRRDEFLSFLKTRWRHILAVEGLFVFLFAFGLLLRLGNPDLWQPWMGGEKPMNLAIFNSVLKSAYFPPNNPWLSGYYLNYYYYGYVLAAIPTKLLGIVPSFAYNLILPTWFAMSGVGAFSIAFTLASRLLEKRKTSQQPDLQARFANLTWAAGLSAVALMLFLGNLYQVRTLWERLPEVVVGAPNDMITGMDRFKLVVEGAGRVISGESQLPGSYNQWYFEPSRPILNEGEDTPIAEFPLFTYLYGDMHPHLLVMPILFAAMGWLLELFFRKDEKRKWIDQLLFWLCAGLVIGVFRGAHTWDYLTLLGLGLIAIGWTSWREHGKVNRLAVNMLLINLGLLIGITYIFYFPFDQWFVTGYNTPELWKGARTPLADYLVVHGVFLSILVSFLLLESAHWIGDRFAQWKAIRYDIILPEPKIWIRWAVVIGAAALAGYFIYPYAQIVVLVIPLLVWIGFIFFRKEQSLVKQIVLALFAAGLAITLVVEFIALKGDVGRMNIVFKFYMQVWAIFSVTAGAAIGLLFSRWRGWPPIWRVSWALVMILLAAGAATYPLTAISARANDRWPQINNPPITLNGMDFMLGEAENVQSEHDPDAGAVYDDDGKLLHLGYDYDGIRYMQENVSGTPTIIEGIRGEYRWTGRYSVHTGLPAVASWSWHVRQHNSLMDGAVVDRRIQEVKDFYETTDENTAVDFLKRYRVGYIIVGDMEREFYAPEGQPKFASLTQQGILQLVFSKYGDAGAVEIYKVTGLE